MDKFECEKIKEVVLYILNKTEGLDYYRLFKVLYFAEREHLMRYGTRMIADNFHRLEYGPVPTNLYNSIKDIRDDFNRTNLDIKDVVRFAKEDASHVLLPQRSSDLDYLSASDIECLDKAIQENAHLSFGKLVEKSHDDAWCKAGDYQSISPADMARAAGAPDSIIEYINEQEEIESILA